MTRHVDGKVKQGSVPPEYAGKMIRIDFDDGIKYSNNKQILYKLRLR
jgi:hypothetical protein